MAAAGAPGALGPVPSSEVPISEMLTGLQNSRASAHGLEDAMAERFAAGLPPASGIPNLEGALGPGKYRLVRKGLEGRLGFEVVHNIVEFLPRASLLTLHVKARAQLQRRVLQKAFDPVIRALVQLGEDEGGELLEGELPGALGTGAFGRSFERAAESMVKVQLRLVQDTVATLEVGPELRRVFEDFDANQDDALDLPEFRSLAIAYVRHVRLLPENDAGAFVQHADSVIQGTTEALRGLGVPEAQLPPRDFMAMVVPQQRELQTLLRRSPDADLRYISGYLAHGDALIKEVFGSLAVAAPDQVFLPEFQARWLREMTRVKHRIVEPFIQEDIARILPKVTEMYEVMEARFDRAAQGGLLARAARLSAVASAGESQLQAQLQPLPPDAGDSL